jgi:hypothetical protein
MGTSICTLQVDVSIDSNVHSRWQMLQVSARFLIFHTACMKQTVIKITF